MLLVGFLAVAAGAAGATGGFDLAAEVVAGVNRRCLLALTGTIGRGELLDGLAFAVAVGVAVAAIDSSPLRLRVIRTVVSCAFVVGTARSDMTCDRDARLAIIAASSSSSSEPTTAGGG